MENGNKMWMWLGVFYFKLMMGYNIYFCGEI